MVLVTRDRHFQEVEDLDTEDGALARNRHVAKAA
jgi:hypothetical protein